MRINAGIAGSAREIFVFPIRNVLVRTWIAVLFGQAKINDMNDTLPFAESNQKIVGFDISMNERFGMDVFESAQQLIGQHEDGFQLKAPSTIIKQVFQAWSQ